MVAALLLSVLIPAEAVERSLKIEAPAVVRAGKDQQVIISASTDAGSGEQVGFLQAEYSIDGGKTWVALCYLQNSGPQVTQAATVKTAQDTVLAQLRARVAFRDGLAGDVDFNGAAIRWEDSWNAWEAPPAKWVEIKVVGH